MSYDSEVLADTPALYYKEEELPGATELEDFSGNDFHADIYSDNVRGVPGPIETDAVSFGIHLRAGTLASPLSSPADPRGNFTLEGWVYEFSDVTYGFATIIARNGQPGVNGGNFLFLNDHNLNADITIGGTTYTVTAPLPSVSGWYYAAVVRNGTALILQLNDAIVDTETIPSGNIDVGADPGWFIGVSAQGTAWQARTSRCAIYPTALTEARRTAHYEAALLATFLNGYSNVIPTAILYSDFEPDPISFPFRHNWSDPLIERISFQTNITRVRSGAEEAGQVRPKPRREIEISQMLRDNAERRMFRAKLWANQEKKWFIPILEDRDRLSSVLSAGATSIPVSTAYKDYSVGGYLGLRQLNGNGTISHNEETLISAVNADSVDVAAITNSYEAIKSEACPVRRGYIQNSVSLRGHTDSVEDVTIVARLVPEDEDAQPNRITPYIVAIKYRDYEVFDGSVWQSNDWSELREYQVDRELEEVDFETGTFTPECDTPGASESFSYRMTIQGRANNAAFLGWFYERSGSLNYVWVPTMQEDFEIVSVSGADLTVEGTDYSDNYALAEARRDLAFIYNDLSMEFRRVTGFSGTTNETLTLDANVPSLTNLKLVSLLKFCRLDADTLEIAKHTDDVWKYAWRFRELLESPAGTGLSSLSPSASVSRSGSPSPSVSPSASVSPSISPSISPSPSLSVSPSASQSPSSSVSRSVSPSGSVSPSASVSPSSSESRSVSPSSSVSPSASVSPS